MARESQMERKRVSWKDRESGRKTESEMERQRVKWKDTD